MYTYLKAASTFGNYSRICFSAQLGAVTCEPLGGHGVSMETVSMVTGHLMVTDDGLAKRHHWVCVGVGNGHVFEDV